MRRNLSIKRFVVLCLAGFLMTTPQIFAEENSGNDDNGNKERNENSIIDNICDRMAKEGEDPEFGPRSFKKITLHATKKVVYVPLWYNEQSPKDNTDPFKPVIRKEVVIPPGRIATGTVTPPPRPPVIEKKIDPLKIFVKGIVGNDEDGRYALVEFGKDEMTVRKDQIVEGKFKVIDVFADRIVVYSNAEQRRYSFKIGDEK